MKKILFTGTTKVPKELVYGFQFEHIPFIKTEMEELSNEDKGVLHDATYTCWVFTSKTGVQSMLNNIDDVSVIKAKRIYTVGKKTAQLLNEYSSNVLIPEEFNATSLANKILGKERNNNLLLFSGRMRKPELTDILTKNKVNFREIFLYKTVLIPREIDVLRYDGIVFFSPSGAHSFFMKNKVMEEQSVFCIGETTADEVKKYFTGNLILPEKSSINGILNAIVLHLNLKITDD